MTTPTTSTANSPTVLDHPQVPVQAKLAAAWTSFMFMYIYVDYLTLYKPGFIDTIRSGVVHDFELGVTFAVMALALVSLPAVMIVLSVALPPRANRAVNLVVATLNIPFALFNASGESEWLPYYGLGIVIELALLGYILRTVCTWPRTRTSQSLPQGAEFLTTP